MNYWVKISLIWVVALILLYFDTSSLLRTLGALVIVGLAAGFTWAVENPEAAQKIESEVNSKL